MIWNASFHNCPSQLDLKFCDAQHIYQSVEALLMMWATLDHALILVVAIVVTFHSWLQNLMWIDIIDLVDSRTTSRNTTQYGSCHRMALSTWDPSHKVFEIANYWMWYLWWWFQLESRRRKATYVKLVIIIIIIIIIMILVQVRVLVLPAMEQINATLFS